MHELPAPTSVPQKTLELNTECQAADPGVVITNTLQVSLGDHEVSWKLMNSEEKQREALAA
jgi:hypothetical protein